MAEVRQRDLTMTNSTPAVGAVERRHTVSLWFYLAGALAFLIGCYLLFLEDGVQSRTTLPSLSPRTQLQDGNTAMEARANIRTGTARSSEVAGIYTAVARPFSGDFIARSRDVVVSSGSGVFCDLQGQRGVHALLPAAGG